MMKIKLKIEEFNKARLGQGLTIAAVAEKAGVSRQALYMVTGERNGLSPKTAKSIADALGVTMEQIFIFVDGKEQRGQ